MASSHIHVNRREDDRPARVVTAMADDLLCYFPPLAQVVVPVLERKRDKHGADAADLTLLVHLEVESIDEEDLTALREALRERSFRSLYLARADVQQVRVVRIY